MSSSTGSVHCIFNAGFLFFHFAFSRSANIDLGNTTGKLCDSLAKFFFIVIAGGLFEFALNACNTSLDFILLASTFDDDGVIFVDLNLLGAAKLLKFNSFELDAQVFKYGLSTSQLGNVFKHCFSAVAIAWSLYCRALEGATKAVDYQSCKGFAFNFFSNNQDRLVGA